jgi:RsiW-degrading membrane proteinase PrsW (M82 family)
MSTSHVGSGQWGLGRLTPTSTHAVDDTADRERSAAISARGRRQPGPWNIVVLMAVIGVLVLGLALVIGGAPASLVPAQSGPAAADTAPGTVANE